METNETLFDVHELADIFQISPQAIRYYHKEKLLIPQVRTEKKYRKYSYNQIYSLAKICYLRKSLFSIADIQQYLTMGDTTEKLEYLQTQSDRVAEQAQSMLRISKAISEKVNFLQSELKNLTLNNPTLCELPQRDYIVMGAETQHLDGDLFFFYPTIACYHQTSPTAYDLIMCAYINRDEPIPPHHQIHSIPAGRFICCYHQGAYHTVAPKISALKAQFPQYTFHEKTFVTNIIDQFIEGDENQYIVRIDLMIV